MSIVSKSFPAKILLFGEYSILLGSSALSIPYHEFVAELRIPENTGKEPVKRHVTSNQHLFTFYEFLAGMGDELTQIMDFTRFHDDLKKGLYFDSTIPAGYGLGSSGALVAAVYERFVKQLTTEDELSRPEEIISLKKIFSDMESFFHGRSSGFDPCVSFLGKPLFLRSDGVPETITLPRDFTIGGAGIFLVNTGQTGRTAPLVRWFLDRFKPDNRITEEGQVLANLVSSLINSFLAFDGTAFWKLIREFSIIQNHDFTPMIPETYIPLWKEGIETGLFYLKLCGSGGGGYLTAFTPDIRKATEYLKKKGYTPVLIRID
jgi:mevalonate kinase